MKKIETKITLANGGMHSLKNFRKAKRMIEECDYVQPRLYHVCLMGSENKKTYKAAVKALRAGLKRRNIPVKWKGCFEDAEDRGFHMHIFLLVDAVNVNPCSMLNRKERGWLSTTVAKWELKAILNPPQNPMHRTKLGKMPNYASLPKNKPEKIADCIEWISYLYKARTKPNMKGIYCGSREKPKGKPLPALFSQRQVVVGNRFEIPVDCMIAAYRERAQRDSLTSRY